MKPMQAQATKRQSESFQERQERLQRETQAKATKHQSVRELQEKDQVATKRQSESLQERQDRLQREVQAKATKRQSSL